MVTLGALLLARGVRDPSRKPVGEEYVPSVAAERPLVLPRLPASQPAECVNALSDGTAFDLAFLEVHLHRLEFHVLLHGSSPVHSSCSTRGGSNSAGGPRAREPRSYVN